MASAWRRTSSRGSEIGPMQRTARPGPGNGWRHTSVSGRPNSSPRRRTSSLNRSLSGSTKRKPSSVGGLPKELGFLLVEPLKDLFKDEVRRLGLELGLPETLVWRHPFPGPGLAVRCIGPISEPRLEVLRQADAIVLDELKQSGWYRRTAQAFAVLLPVQSVGVMGDGRTYENAIAVRAVQTDDFMTADWSHLPYDLLAKISTGIMN